jgi:hypothetical protein
MNQAKMGDIPGVFDGSFRLSISFARFPFSTKCRIRVMRPESTTIGQSEDSMRHASGGLDRWVCEWPPANAVIYVGRRRRAGGQRMTAPVSCGTTTTQIA